LMGKDISGASADDAGEILAGAVVEMMRKVGMPNGLRAVGYGPDDLEKLVEGTLPQHRVTKLSPRPADAEDLKKLFLDSMTLW
jgi:hydroxyacid-oxoacid transhydrogenase